MKNLEELKKAIQKTNPEIMELRFGCMYKVPKRDKRLIFKIRTDHEIQSVNNIENVEILGRPINL